MRAATDPKLATSKVLQELKEELELWVEIYVSSRDETSALVARYFMLKVHAKYRAEFRRLLFLKSHRTRGTGFSSDPVTAARAVPIEIVLEKFFGYRLDRHGRGKCPFHGGSNPQSLHKLPSGNRVFCHVCQRSWDPVGALMTLKGIDFGKAVEILADT